METDAFQNSPPNPDLYRTDELQPWIAAYLFACHSRNLASGTLEFYSKKLKTFAGFRLENDVDKISGIHAELIRHFLIVLAEKNHSPAGVHC